MTLDFFLADTVCNMHHIFLVDLPSLGPDKPQKLTCLWFCLNSIATDIFWTHFFHVNYTNSLAPSVPGDT